MRFIYGKDSWRTLDIGEENCFLLTNGLGGFCSLSLIGSNVRNDHGLLMAAMKAPTVRYHMVTNVHSMIVIGKGDILPEEACRFGIYPDNKNLKVYDLSSQRYVNRTKNCDGCRHLQCFDFEYFPRWQYQAEDVEVVQTVFMKHGENTVCVQYDIYAETEGSLVLTPWFQFVPKGQRMMAFQKFEMDSEKIVSNGISLYYKTNGAVKMTETVYCDDWYYEQDARDGREATGCAASNHRIVCDFTPGRQRFFVIYSTELQEIDNDKIGDWVKDEMEKEVRRQKTLVKTAGLKNPLAQVLVRSANQYLVERHSTNSQSMIAGYPFFGDWGRDTMIAMSGCTISTKQFESTKRILRTFMAYCHKGLMPNMFPENDAAPVYNTVDAALLFIEVVYRYWRVSKDWDFVSETWQTMQDIIYWYKNGTDYHIYMDSDGLIAAGGGLYQLTWMDVRAGDILPTPRHGKPVEINAYWYNALMIMAELAGGLQKVSDAGKKSKSVSEISETADAYRQMAAQAKESFMRLFWNEEKGYLRDVISGTAADEQIRCNQIWALTMSFVMIDKGKAQRILKNVHKHLYTPWGLRSLSPKDREYHGAYGGSQFFRDMAYHQGTVWGYPLGAYYLAVLRWADDKKAAVCTVKRKLLAMEACLREGCIGHIAEIYDGDCQDTSKGCFAQAWSVGELLRVYEKIEKMEGQWDDLSE